MHIPASSMFGVHVWFCKEYTAQLLCIMIECCTGSVDYSWIVLCSQYLVRLGTGTRGGAGVNLGTCAGQALTDDPRRGCKLPPRTSGNSRESTSSK